MYGTQAEAYVPPHHSDIRSHMPLAETGWTRLQKKVAKVQMNRQNHFM